MSLRQEDLAELARELAALVHQRRPLPPALRALAGDVASGPLEGTIARLAAELEKGTPLGAALERTGAPAAYGALVAAGVAAGDAGAALELVAAQAEAEAVRRTRLETLLAYPAVLTAAGLVVVAGILAGPVHQFEALFESMNVELPWITQVCLAIASYLHGNVGAAVALITIAALSIVVLAPRAFAWLVSWQSPAAGLGHLARTLASFLERGVPASTALRALEPCATGLGRGALERAARRIEGGARLADALELERVFPSELVWTLGAAESRGTLTAALRSIADRHERRFEGFALLVEQALAPLLFVPIALICNMTVLAIFLPIFKLQQALQQ